MNLKSLFVLATTTTLLIATPVLADPKYPSLAGKPVIDAANIIPADREARLNQQLLDYERTTGHQLVVATVPSLDGYDIETYAEGYFDVLKLGHADVDDGVLLLHAPTEREMRIEVGYGLEPVLTDAASKLIIVDVMTPLFKAGDLVGGLEGGATAIMQQTQMDQAAIEEFRVRKAAADKAEQEAFNAAVGDFFMTVLGFGIVTGFFWFLFDLFIAGPRRRRLAREREKLREEARKRQLEESEERQRQRDERNRLAAAEAKKQAERQAALAYRKAQERQTMLMGMTPAAREAFLASERRQAEKAAAAERVRIEKRRQEDEENRKRRQRDEEDRRRRQREDDDRRSQYSPSPTSYSPPASNFGGGGGDSGGGGASGSY